MGDDDQAATQPPPALGRRHGKPVDVASPAVPGGYRRADDRIAKLRDQQRSRVVGEQAVDQRRLVFPTRPRADGYGPNAQHLGFVFGPGGPHDAFVQGCVAAQKTGLSV